MFELISRFTENITLMLFSKLIADNYNYHIKHINVVCGQTSNSVTVTAGSIYRLNNHCAARNLWMVIWGLCVKKFIPLVRMDLVFYTINKRWGVPPSKAVQ